MLSNVVEMLHSNDCTGSGMKQHLKCSFDCAKLSTKNRQCFFFPHYNALTSLTHDAMSSLLRTTELLALSQTLPQSESRNGAE